MKKVKNGLLDFNSVLGAITKSLSGWTRRKGKTSPWFQTVCLYNSKAGGSDHIG